ncbi:hypothetical protein S7711_10630 [Stachybotrys chartarum IBT 7711]|uniref:Uncharacterized protein n=1 Tax=Stachybotrys chartarum (strain CBS 109288 / IBT 7711) TaxID=1280523 RepID=A0A084AM23_STACB|nr:hypothetical protein S7711_10630 [Stachybotrys chartarum IBT 7711]
MALANASLRSHPNPDSVLLNELPLPPWQVHRMALDQDARYGLGPPGRAGNLPSGASLDSSKRSVSSSESLSPPAYAIDAPTPPSPHPPLVPPTASPVAG